MNGQDPFKKKSSLIRNLIKALPIIIFAGMVPFLVGYNQYILPPVKVTWNPSAISGADLFNLIKARGIMLAGFLSLLYMFFSITVDRKTFLKNRTVQAVLGFVAVLLLTTLLSFSKYNAIIGSYDRFEGLLVWLSYIACALYTAWLFREKNTRVLVLRSILIGGLGVTTVGVFQFLGLDLFKNTMFQTLVLPKEVIGSIGFIFEVGRVYSTLYNPNYMAFYVAMMLPFSLFMVFADESKIFKALWVAYVGLLFVCLMGSEGRGGLLGLTSAALAVTAVLLMKKINNPKFNIGVVAIGTLAVFGGFAALAMGALDTVKGDVSVHTTQVSDIEIVQDQVHIQYGEHQLNLKMNLNDITSLCQVTDENGQAIGFTMDADNYFVITDPKYPNAKYIYAEAGEGYYYIDIFLDGVSWPFIMQEDGFKFINTFGARTQIDHPQHWGFKGSELLGSNRGYIWSRTLPVIAKSPLIGYGADNFAFVFPQEEYVKKQLYYGNYKVIVDKPHNFYLQMLISFGVLGFLALYALIGLALSFLYKNFTAAIGNEKWYYLALIAGIFGYLGSGLFYDSTVNISPLFWTFIGVGLQGFYMKANDSKALNQK